MYLLQQALDLAAHEFQDSVDSTAQSGGSSRSIQWNGLRYMLAEVRMSSIVNHNNFIKCFENKLYGLLTKCQHLVLQGRALISFLRNNGMFKTKLTVFFSHNKAKKLKS